MWESLVYDEPIGERLLSLVQTALLFAEQGVNPQLVACTPWATHGRKRSRAGAPANYNESARCPRPRVDAPATAAPAEAEPSTSPAELGIGSA